MQHALRKSSCGEMSGLLFFKERSWVKGITWFFCLGHVGVRGNEITDTLARKVVIDGTVMLRDGSKY